MSFKRVLGAFALAIAVAFAAVPAAQADCVQHQLEDAIAKLSEEQQTALLLLLNSVGGGEAAAAGGSPEDQAKAAVKAFAAEGSKGNVEGMLALFSDDFEHYEYGDKEGLEEFLSEANDMGYLEEMEIILDDAEFEIDGDTMTVYPVELEGLFGSLTFEYIFQNEGGTWKIIEFDASGL